MRPGGLGRPLLDPARDALGGQRREAVAGVHAGRVELLEDPGHAPVLPVADDIDVELDPIHHRVHAQRPADLGGEQVRDIAPRAGPRSPPADHPRWPHDDRQAELVDHVAQLVGVGRQPPARPVDPQLVEQRGEALAVLGQLDRLAVSPAIGTSA